MKVQGSKVQGSEVQSSKVHGSKNQGSTVQGSQVFKVRKIYEISWHIGLQRRRAHTRFLHSVRAHTHTHFEPWEVSQMIVNGFELWTFQPWAFEPWFLNLETLNPELFDPWFFEPWTFEPWTSEPYHYRKNADRNLDKLRNTNTTIEKVRIAI